MNKNNGVIIIIGVIIIVLLAYIAFKPKAQVPLSSPTIPQTQVSVEPSSTKTTSSQTVTWIQSPDSKIQYASQWAIMPYNYNTPADESAGKPAQRVGWIFTLSDGAILTWGGNQSACSSTDPEFKTFTYGSSNTACVKGLSASIYKSGYVKLLTPDDKKAFGDFVIKNQ